MAGDNYTKVTTSGNITTQVLHSSPATKCTNRYPATVAQSPPRGTDTTLATTNSTLPTRIPPKFLNSTTTARSNYTTTGGQNATQVLQSSPARNGTSLYPKTVSQTPPWVANSISATANSTLPTRIASTFLNSTATARSNYTSTGGQNATQVLQSSHAGNGKNLYPTTVSQTPPWVANSTSAFANSTLPTQIPSMVLNSTTTARSNYTTTGQNATQVLQSSPAGNSTNLYLTTVSQTPPWVAGSNSTTVNPALSTMIPSTQTGVSSTIPSTVQSSTITATSDYNITSGQIITQGPTTQTSANNTVTVSGGKTVTGFLGWIIVGFGEEVGSLAGHVKIFDGFFEIFAILVGEIFEVIKLPGGEVSLSSVSSTPSATVSLKSSLASTPSSSSSSSSSSTSSSGSPTPYIILPKANAGENELDSFDLLLEESAPLGSVSNLTGLNNRFLFWRASLTPDQASKLGQEPVVSLAHLSLIAIGIIPPSYQ